MAALDNARSWKAAQVQHMKQLLAFHSWWPPDSCQQFCLAGTCLAQQRKALCSLCVKQLAAGLEGLGSQG